MSAYRTYTNYQTEAQMQESFFRARLVPWPPELEELFIWTVNHLGGPYRATPAMIAQTMRVPGLTVSTVTGYLTVYRMMADNHFVIGGMQQISFSFVHRNFPAPPRYFGPPGSGVPYNSTYTFSTHPGQMQPNYMLANSSSSPADQHLSLPPARSPSINESWTPSTRYLLNEAGTTSGQPDLSLSLGISSEPHMSADAGDENEGLDLSLSLGLPNVTSADIAELEARELRYEVAGSSHSCEVIVIDDDDSSNDLTLSLF